MYTEKDKKLAQSIISNEPVMELLKKVLIQPQKNWSGEILTMKNEDLGELVKADVMAQQEILRRFEILEKLGTQKKEGKPKVVPI